MDDLPNGYAFKYTVSLLKTPSGRSFEGEGLPPDVVVSMDEHSIAFAAAAPTPAARLERDLQLRTAKELVTRR